MSAPNTEELNPNITGDETQSLGSHEKEDVGNAASSSGASITSEEVARQNKTAFDPLSKRLGKLPE